MWWGGLNKGDSLVLEVPLDRTAEYELQLHLSKAHDYGIFSFQLDDGPDERDNGPLQSETSRSLRLHAKTFHVGGGKHQLKIICQGQNPASTNTLIGLDYVVLKSI